MRLLIIGAVISMSACGGAEMRPTQPTPLFSSSSLSSSSVRVRSLADRYSCPTGNAPTGLTVNTKDGTAQIFLDRTEGIPEHIYEVQRFNPPGPETVSMFQAPGTLDEQGRLSVSWRPQDLGTFQVRAWGKNACGGLTPATPWVWFDFESGSQSGGGRPPCVGTPNFCGPNGEYLPTPWRD